MRSMAAGADVARGLQGPLASDRHGVLQQRVCKQRVYRNRYIVVAGRRAYRPLRDTHRYMPRE
jgi:hypothetical protein